MDYLIRMQGDKMEQDIRWKQRFTNFRKALALLREALETKMPSTLEFEQFL